MVPKWITPIVVAVVAGISVWLLSEQAPKKPRLITADNTVPDAYMEDFTTYIMGENGKLRHELSASYMANFSSDDRSEFISPEFIFYRSDESQWVMSAESGTSKDGSKEITLQGKVTILRKQLNAGDVKLKIVTSELLIRPDDSYAETDQLITITSGKHKLESKGFRAYFDDERVELLSRVRGEYAL
jgi:lipopolysaccharide export system protein LptC